MTDFGATDYNALIKDIRAGAAWEDEEYGPGAGNLDRSIADALESLRSRIAALEAVIRFVREEAAAWQNAPHGEVAPVNGVGDVFANLVAVAPSVVLDEMIREAKAEAVEAARDAIMPPVNWNLRPDGTEMPGTQHIDDALHDIHVQLSEVAAAYRSGCEVARD